MAYPRKSPAEKAATRLARERRYRARQKEERLAAAEAEKQATVYADHILGVVESPGARPPKGTDVAKLLQSRYLDIIDNMSDEALMVKDFAPGLNVALKAQDIIDKRERQKTSKGNADLAFAIIGMLGGAVPLQVGPGDVVEGESVEVVDEAV